MCDMLKNKFFGIYFLKKFAILHITPCSKETFLLPFYYVIKCENTLDSTSNSVNILNLHDLVKLDISGKILTQFNMIMVKPILNLTFFEFGKYKVREIFTGVNL